MTNYDEIRLKDVQIKKDGDGVLVKGRGDNRFITYDELVELVKSDGEVTIR